MNVAVLIASLGGGGAEKMAIRLSHGLSKAGMKSCLITLDGERDYPVKSSKVLSFSKTTWPTLAKTAMIPLQINRLEAYLKDNHIEVVISFLERANIVNLMQRAVPCRIISIRTHSSRMMAAKSPIKRKLVSWGYKKLLSRADAIVCNSMEMKYDFNGIYGPDLKRLDVIYNFFESKLHQAAAEALSHSEQKMFQGPTIITAGRLTIQKGQWHLIRAFKRISDAIDDARLIILGKGELADTYAQMCDNLGISDKVFFHGFVPNPLKYIAKADIFAFPSLWEGFPNALLEAMAVGTPVISADCSSGPRELLVPDSNAGLKTQTPEITPYGILIPPLDGKIRKESSILSREELHLSDGIIHMLKDTTYLANCRREVLRRSAAFTEEAVIGQWTRLIKEIKPHADS